MSVLQLAGIAFIAAGFWAWSEKVSDAEGCGLSLCLAESKCKSRDESSTHENFMSRLFLLK